MTGTERLRTLAGEWDEYGLSGALADVARQIERERACDEDAIENVRLIVGGVIDSMERHVLGHEGMEDSPVARWARELREALGGHVEEVTDVATIRKDAYDAYEWVREHGGLDAVKRRWDCLSYYADPVPRSCMDKRLARLQRQIDESHSALRRRNERIAELEHERGDLYEMMRRLNAQADETEARLMPEGCEWPRFEDGARLAFEDELTDFAHTIYKTVKTVKFLADGTAELTNGGGSANVVVIVRPGERVKRPAKPEPPKRCRDCAHWQKDPTADKVGVCWFLYHEREGQDCYAARRADIGACDEFMPRGKALAGDA